ncbi:MAG: hypothetical protein HFE36_03170 [Clostridia bacterium]|nr:hypothetical protein [Clostridia bacterium]
MAFSKRLSIVHKAFKGIRLIRKLMRRNKNYLLILSNLNGIGDICIEMAYFPEYVKMAPNKAKFVVSKLNESLVEQFGVLKENFIMVLCEEIECMEIAMSVSYFKHWTDKWVRNKKIISGNPGYYVDSKLSRVPSISALDIMKFGVYNLSDDCKPCYPHVSSAVERTPLVKPYIIINPYSNSNAVPIELFHTISRKLISAGYHVYTNLAFGQTEIENTVPLNISIQELFLLANDAECIISIRSGVLDYVVSNTKRIICIYNESSAWVTSSFYSLEKWETDCEIFNHVYPNSIDINEIVKEAIGDAD